MKRLRDTGLLLAVLSVWTVPAGAQALFGNTYGDTATTQQEVESPLLQIQPWPGEAEQGGPTGQSAEETASSYRVLGGDSLSRIAGEVYGDSGLWPAIFNANYDLLRGDPGLIVPGMRLEIPGFEDALADAVPRNIVARAAPESTGRSGRANAGGSWIYSEGIARAIRREFMTFESAGRIAYLDPDLKEGDQVTKGQVIAYQDQRRPLAEIENAESSIVAAQTQLAVAEATQMEVAADLRLAERTFERFSVLLQQNSASQQEYDEAQAQLESARAAAVRASRQIETAQAQIRVAEATRSTASVVRDESYLIAPIDGVVARINYDQGDYYSPQLINTATEQQVFDTVPVILIDPSRFEISLNVPSNLLDTLEVGADVLIGVIEPDATLADRLPDVSAGPPKPASDYSIAGQVYAISPVFDTDLRNFLVKVRTSRGNEYLRDGATVSMWIRKRG